MEDSDMDKDSPEVDEDMDMDMERFEDARGSPAPANTYTQESWPYGRKEFVVEVPEVRNRKSYHRDEGEFVVARIRNKAKLPTGIQYQAQFENDSLLYLPFSRLKHFVNGQKLVKQFERNAIYDDDEEGLDESEEEEEEEEAEGTSEDELATQQPIKRRKVAQPEDSEDDDVDMEDVSSPPKRKTAKRRKLVQKKNSILNYMGFNESEDDAPPKRNSRPVRNRISTKTAEFVSIEDVDLPSEEEELSTAPTRRSLRSQGAAEAIQIEHGFQTDEESDAPRKAKRKPAKKGKNSEENSDSDNSASKQRSGRARTNKTSYKLEYDEDNFEEYHYVEEKKPAAVKITEVYPTYSSDDPFINFHMPFCQSCKETADASGRKKLIYCQGCCFSYHPSCIGSGKARQHQVTLLDSGISVLQCVNCINKRREKDPLAPEFDVCATCKEHGHSCERFDHIVKGKVTESENKDDTREEFAVPEHLVNNPDTTMFRCLKCRRAYHFECLPPIDIENDDAGLSDEELRLKMLNDYSNEEQFGIHWHCIDCRWMDETDRIETIAGWKPIDGYKNETVLAKVPEHKREYLVKRANRSYHHLEWKDGYWCYNVLPHKMRQAFNAKQYDPVQSAEEAVPPEYLRVELILDVKTKAGYRKSPATFEDALKQIDKVTAALVKFEGLNFDDVVWQEAPKEDDPYYEEFKTAFSNFARGYFVRPSENVAQKVRDTRALFPTFDEELFLKEQPTYIKGGKLMGYQEEGVNWLYKKWVEGQNCLLSDEMGLGKTIQIISFLSVLQMRHEIWPFLVIVPLSTVPNWRREILKWVPDMRVVTYAGGSEAKELIRKYDMFDENKRLKCHVVISEYNTIRDDNELRKIKWQCLVADEAQRLKNDDSMVHKALDMYKAEHRVLMTGTPLQNNIRELLNLLQFVDRKNFNAKKLEETEYSEVTTEKVKNLREILKTYQKRRTKAQVLGFLPPVIDVIVPLTMTALQKKLYKSILEKNAPLIHSILSKTKTSGKKEKLMNLNGILTQLRKTLCHPFLYNADIEETSLPLDVRFQNLVNASAKFQFLSSMLPALKERGHRVLMFSQFLGMLDFVGDLLDHLGYGWARIDGSDSSLERQKRIDAYNEPDSELFAFLLSTRAGGVGINLATADTVMILDPDFNPHQDMQALARAHRIGQKKPVRVFFLMTRSTAEEKIMERGKKKMSLDHVIIEMEDEDEDDEGIDSILKYGAKALFDENDEEDAIRYDEKTVNDLLDRTKDASGLDDTEETGFKYARVWTKSTGDLVELEEKEEEEPMSEDMWLKIIQEREAVARAEALDRERNLGRGHRRHGQKAIRYNEREGLDSDTIEPEEHEMREEPAASGDEYDDPNFRNAHIVESEEGESDVENYQGDMDLGEKPQSKSRILPPDTNGIPRNAHPPILPGQPVGPNLVQQGVVRQHAPFATQPQVPYDSRANGFARMSSYSNTPPPNFGPFAGAPIPTGMPVPQWNMQRPRSPILPPNGFATAPPQMPFMAPQLPQQGHAMRPNFMNGGHDPMLPGFADNASFADMNGKPFSVPKPPPMQIPPPQIDLMDDDLPSPILDNNEVAKQIQRDIISLDNTPAPSNKRPSTMAPPQEKQTTGRPRRTTLLTERTTPTSTPKKTPRRKINDHFPATPPPGTPVVACAFCGEEHAQSYCPIKLQPPEACPLCDVPHVAGAECERFQNVEELREILDSLKKAEEDPELVQIAKNYVQGRIGSLQRLGKTVKTPKTPKDAAASTLKEDRRRKVIAAEEVGESPSGSASEGPAKRKVGRPRKYQTAIEWGPVENQEGMAARVQRDKRKKEVDVVDLT